MASAAAILLWETFFTKLVPLRRDVIWCLFIFQAKFLQIQPPPPPQCNFTYNVITKDLSKKPKNPQNSTQGAENMDLTEFENA